MKILIVLNQTDSVEPIGKHDFIIGVDGGCSWCLQHNQLMDLAIGDFDSICPADLDKLSHLGVPIQRHPSDKDFTDLELAINVAMEHSPSLITVMGVWGGRQDHCLANVFCLSQQTGRTPIIMPGKKESGYVIKDQQKLTIESGCNQVVSILAMSPVCSGISNKGFKFPLTAAELNFGYALGLSNITIEPQSEVTLDIGNLLILTDNDSVVRISEHDRGNISERP